MGVVSFLCMIWVAYKIVGEEWGMGDYYRNCARNEKNPEVRKAYNKRASESDGAVGCCVVFLGFVGIIFIVALFGSI